MPRFVAKVAFRFEAESLEAAGQELYRLGEAAAVVGFDLTAGEVVPAQAEEDEAGPTYYVPLTPPQE